MRNILITLWVFSHTGIVGFHNLYAEESNNIAPKESESNKDNVSENEIKVPNEYTSDDQVIEDKESNLILDSKTKLPIDGTVKIFYEPSHALKSIIDYKNGKYHGFIKGYFENGKLQVEGKFINGNSDGPLRLYYESGKLNEEMPFKDGKPEGLVKIYYESGKLKGEMLFKDGKPEGLVKTYYESGKIKEEKIFKNGKLEGTSKIYSEETGKKTKEIQFKNGVTDGVVRNYYENGALNSELYFKNGKKSGDVSFYLENGKLCARVIYKDDHPISGKKANGKKLNKAELLSFDNHAPVNCDWN